MKVSTDACILGALAATQAVQLPIGARFLDIGTGTGLLSLFLAQQHPAKIDAVEVDEAAAAQAQTNFDTTTWTERLKLHTSSIQAFTASATQCYDLVICNPPFFENDLPSIKSNAQVARHSTQLSLKELLYCITQLLKPNGFCYLLLPIKRQTELEKLLAVHQLKSAAIAIQYDSGKAAKLAVFVISQSQPEPSQASVIIKTESGNYTAEFKSLLAPFYLPTLFETVNQ